MTAQAAPDKPTYTPVAEARTQAGLRLVVHEGTPAPWSEAVKAIFRLKNIPFTPVPQRISGERDAALFQWTGSWAAPVAMLDEERPRTSWDQILLLAERLAAEPRLIPANEAERAQMMGLCQEIAGEDGFGWNCRVFLILTQEQDVSPDDPISLQRHDHGMSPERWEFFRYRYIAPNADKLAARARVVAILDHLAKTLQASRARGSRYLVGDSLTAVDLYWTAFSNIIAPIPFEKCPQSDFYYVLNGWFGDNLGSSLDPALIEHRDFILDRHFPLPMWF
jgi:glutathione S-transferase